MSPGDGKNKTFRDSITKHNFIFFDSHVFIHVHYRHFMHYQFDSVLFCPLALCTRAADKGNWFTTQFYQFLIKLQSRKILRGRWLSTFYRMEEVRRKLTGGDKSLFCSNVQCFFLANTSSYLTEGWTKVWTFLSWMEVWLIQIMIDNQWT